MLSYARANIEEKGLRNCQVRQADMYTLPFANQSQDLLVVHQVLHYSERPRSVLEEARRILRSNGLMLLIDFAPHNVRSLQEDHAHVQMGFAAEEIEQICKEIGFSDLTLDVLKGNPLTVNIWSAEIAAKN
jgi:ArsR family transcriptional regulator